MSFHILATEASSFSAEGWVELTMSNQFKRSKLLSQQKAAHGRQRRAADDAAQTLSLKFRTRANDGILFYAKSPSEYTILQVINTFWCEQLFILVDKLKLHILYLSTSPQSICSVVCCYVSL